MLVLRGGHHGICSGHCTIFVVFGGLGEYCFGLGWVGRLFVRVLAFGFIATPLKTRTEPEYHPFGKEQHLPNLPFQGSMLVFRGVLVRGFIHI